MTKLMRISARVAYVDVLSDLRKLNLEFIRGCGENIPGLDPILHLSEPRSETVREMLKEHSPTVMKYMKGYPAYPCVKSVMNYLKGISNGE